VRILFVCTGNTCRSPMAERLARLLYPAHRWESAGVMPTGGIHPLTALVLAECGADAEDFSGRHVADLDLAAYDHVVLIGHTAAALAPDPPPGVAVHHWDVADPFESVGTHEQVLEDYRACAEELTERITALVEQLA
jgi:protein-tyrosine-phosphatase